MVQRREQGFEKRKNRVRNKRLSEREKEMNEGERAKALFGLEMRADRQK